MIDPRMMQMGMGQLPNVPTPQQLWKEEKEKFRHWIILFAIGIMAIIACFVAVIAWNIADKSEIIDGWINDPDMDLDDYGWFGAGLSDWNMYFNLSYIVEPALQMGVLAIGFIAYVVSVVISYKKKSFAHLSRAANIIIGIGAFFAMYSIFSLIWQRLDFGTRSNIFHVVINILYVAVSLGFGGKITRIKRTFMMSEKITELKNSPEYKQMQEQMASGQFNPQMGPFGPAMGGMPMPGAMPQPMPTPSAQPATPGSQEEVKLSKLSVADLQAVAKKLSISGTEKMNKAELIESITRITGKTAIAPKQPAQPKPQQPEETIKQEVKKDDKPKPTTNKTKKGKEAKFFKHDKPKKD